MARDKVQWRGSMKTVMKNRVPLVVVMGTLLNSEVTLGYSRRRLRDGVGWQ
jgi:hypothetical protein